MPRAYQTYTVPHGLIQDDRMSEGTPVGSRGGTAIRHRFPVDGEYEISVDAAAGPAGRRSSGMNEERKLDLRLDDQRLELFTIAANREARAVLGSGKRPDAHLKVRLPVKAGTHEIAATFLKDTVLTEGIIDRIRDDQVQAYFEGVGSDHGRRPVQCARAGRDAEPREDFHLPSGRARR